MNVLIFNCGSSSQSFKVFRASADGQPVVFASGKARNVATLTQANAVIDWQLNGRAGSKTIDLPSHRRAALEHVTFLKENGVRVDAVGHRFVHGGDLFDRTAKIDAEALPKLRQCLPLAPIHNPNSYSVIEVCGQLLPGVPQYAVFDTAFHAQMPEAAKRYALPQALAKQQGFHKYGFHGLSCQFVSARAAELLGKPLTQLKLILCHLGTGGASVTAVQAGQTLDTSMGYSPLAGLVMSTRCGDLDAEIVLELVRQGHSADEISAILNHQSGLIGLSGYSSNLAEVIEASEAGDTDCRIAFEVYVHRLKLYLGAYSWLLNGADVIVFTDDLGMKSWKLRAAVCGGAENLGVVLDEDANRAAPAGGLSPARISRADSPTQVWIVPTDEERVIFDEVVGRMESGDPASFE